MADRYGAMLFFVARHPGFSSCNADGGPLLAIVGEQWSSWACAPVFQVGYGG
jgi:hypothetical protein